MSTADWADGAHGFHVEASRFFTLPSTGEASSFASLAKRKRSPEELAWRESSGINEAAHRCDALANVTSDLHAKLVRTPAPHAAALLFKLEWALDGEGEPFVDVSTVIVEDAKRLLA